MPIYDNSDNSKGSNGSGGMSERLPIDIPTGVVKVYFVKDTEVKGEHPGPRTVVHYESAKGVKTKWFAKNDKVRTLLNELKGKGLPLTARFEWSKGVPEPNVTIIA